MKTSIFLFFCLVICVLCQAGDKKSNYDTIPLKNLGHIEGVQTELEIQKTVPLTSKINIHFLYFKPNNKGPVAEWFKNSNGISTIRQKYMTSRIPMFINENGEIESVIDCPSLFNIGIFLQLSEYDYVEIESPLNFDGKNHQIALKSLIGNNKTDGAIFVRLIDVLKKAHNNVSDYKDEQWEHRLKDKICPLLFMEKGIGLKFLGKENNQIIYLRSIGLPSNNPWVAEKTAKIEPRQYVTIYEKQQANQSSVPIWWLKNKQDELVQSKFPFDTQFEPGFIRKFYPVQEQKVVDTKTTLEIRFDHEMLARNIDFYGNISLAATINDQLIEVNPYTLIGKDKKSYGVNSKPIKEIANNFLNLMIEGNKVMNDYNKIKGLFVEKEQTDLTKPKQIVVKRLNGQIRTLVDKISEFSMLQDTSKIPADFLDQELHEKLASLIPLTTTIDSLILINIINNFQIKTSNNTILDLKNIITRGQSSFLDQRELMQKIEKRKKGLDSIKLIEIQKISKSLIWPYTNRLAENHLTTIDLNKLMNDKLTFSQITRLINNLKEYNKENDSSIVSPKFMITNDNTTSYRRYIKNIELCLKYMNYFRSSGKQSMDAFLNLSLVSGIEFENLYETIKFNLNELKREGMDLKIIFGKNYTNINFRTKILNDAILQLSHAINAVLTDDMKMKIDGMEKIDPEKPVEITRVIYKGLEDPSTYREIQNDVALRAGLKIFSGMLFATIDLEKALAKDGDVLEIKVMWYNFEENTTDAEQGVELSTAKFLIKKTGWHINTPESVLLIQRINEDLVTVDKSPSNFKPTAGISLIWTYHNDFRGKKIKKFLRWVEPSFGINVSFLDFDIKETFEIGAGPIIGLWQNQLFFTGGYNFNVKGQSPFYIGIGFSFSNIVGKIKAEGKLN